MIVTIRFVMLSGIMIAVQLRTSEEGLCEDG